MGSLSYFGDKKIGQLNINEQIKIKEEEILTGSSITVEKIIVDESGGDLNITCKESITPKPILTYNLEYNSTSKTYGTKIEEDADKVGYDNLHTFKWFKGILRFTIIDGVSGHKGKPFTTQPVVLPVRVYAKDQWTKLHNYNEYLAKKNGGELEDQKVTAAYYSYNSFNAFSDFEHYYFNHRYNGYRLPLYGQNIKVLGGRDRLRYHIHSAWPSSQLEFHKVEQKRYSDGDIDYEYKWQDTAINDFCYVQQVWECGAAIGWKEDDCKFMLQYTNQSKFINKDTLVADPDTKTIYEYATDNHQYGQTIHKHFNYFDFCVMDELSNVIDWDGAIDGNVELILYDYEYYDYNNA